MYSLDENLLQGGVENLKEKANKITHLSIANPKVAPYGVAAKEVLENLGSNELLKDKIVLGENISVPVLHVDSKNSDIAIVAYSLVSSINHPKGKAVIIDAKYFSPLEQSYVITKYAKDKKLAFEFNEFIGSSKAKEIFKNTDLAHHEPYKRTICELLNQEDIVIVKILSKEVIFSVLMLELKSLENFKNWCECRTSF